MNQKIFGLGLLCAILLFFSTPTHAQAPLGEVYLLKSLDVNPIYKGQAIYANVEVGYVQRGNPAYPAVGFGTVTFSVVEEDGNPVPGISISPVPVDFTSSDEVSFQIPLEGPGTGDFFEVGKTYAVEVEIIPYFVGGNSNVNEIVIGNNRVRKTFTVINPPVTFSIPDMPFALVVLTFSVVLGWLFSKRVRKKHRLKK